MCINLKNSIKKILCLAFLFICLIVFSAFAKSTAHMYCSTCEKNVDAIESTRPGGMYAYTCPTCHKLIKILDKQAENSEKDKMSDDEILNDKRFSFIRSMIVDICSIEETNNNSSSILNTDSLMDKMFQGAINSINRLSSSSIYFCFQGIGIFLLIFHFCFSIYENNSITDRMTVEQTFKLFYRFIISLMVVLNLKLLLNLLISFSSFILHNTINYKNSGASSTNVNSDQSVVNQVFINLIRANGLDKSGVLDKFASTITQIGLLIPLIIPWLLSFVAKFGILFSIAKNAIEMVAYAAMYPIAAGDCYDNIKNSRFFGYTKAIFGCALQMAVIVIILMASNILLTDILNSILGELSKIDQENTSKVFSTLILLTVMQLSKMAVVTSASSVIANKVVGA